MDKKATTVDEQISLLKKRGMIIKDDKKAEEVLLDIGYFRLGFYCFPFETTYPCKKNRTHIYQDQTSLQDVVKLYYFDYKLRNILIKYINRIEINFRTFLTYSASNKYPTLPTWFVDISVIDSTYADSFGKKVYDQKFKLNPIIKHHHDRHPNDQYAPAWKTIEFMTFGSVLMLFQALQSDTLKKEISSQFNIKSVKVFKSYMNTIRVIRNICAHGGVLFDISLSKSIMKGPADLIEQKEYQNLNGAIKVISYILRQVSSRRADDLNNEINELFKEHESNTTLKVILQEATGMQL